MKDSILRLLNESALYVVTAGVIIYGLHLLDLLKV